MSYLLKLLKSKLSKNSVWNDHINADGFPNKSDIHTAQMIRAYGPDEDEDGIFCSIVYETMAQRKKTETKKQIG